MDILEPDPQVDAWHARFVAAGNSVDLILDAEKEYGLGAEVLIQAAGCLNIEVEELDRAIQSGYAEWIK